MLGQINFRHAIGPLSVKLLTEHHLEFLCLNRGCTGSPESSLHLSKCHIVWNNMLWLIYHVRIQRGGTGGPDPLENYKNIGFLSNTCPDPLKSQRYQVSIQCLAIIGPPAKRHLNGVSLAGQWWAAKSGNWILHQTKKKRQCLTPSDKTFWITACILWICTGSTSFRCFQCVSTTVILCMINYSVVCW